MVRRRGPTVGADPRRWGVEVGYHDAVGGWHNAPAATIEAILAAMGASTGDGVATPPAHPDDRDGGSAIITVRTDHPLPPVPAGVLEMEDGAQVRIDGALPPDITIGYHHIEADDGGRRHDLVVSPGMCPAGPSRQWGWATQLYATRSRSSWGHGDLADLRRLTEWSAAQGAGMTLVNPLHAGAMGTHPQPSPYFPSSRCFLNPLYLRVEDIPGAEAVADVETLAAAGRQLNDQRLIDRDQVWALKSAALEAIFARFDHDVAFDRFVSERGQALAGFATFAALAEIHGPGWAGWPAGCRRPDGPGVADLTAEGAGARRIRYHQWLQWQLDAQLKEASTATALMADLAIGVDAGGADAWLWQDTFASTMRVGAPPDEFNTRGQNWGLPPWDPWRLRDARYRPFIETIRGGLRHGGGLRFDHVMGLFRLYWIPEGASAAEGTYVRYPYWDLLNILALEATRAGAYVVGEDLGTVEDHVRHELRQRQVLSYRLLWFEPDRPKTWPEQALGSVTTHDLPTVAGAWSGSDLAVQRDLGLEPNEVGSAAMRARLADWGDVADDADSGEVIKGAYRSLGQAPCSVLTATLDDALAVEERPNMPGTVDEWPNWRIGLPSLLDDIEVAPLAAAIAEALGRVVARADPGPGGAALTDRS